MLKRALIKFGNIGVSGNITRELVNDFSLLYLARKARFYEIPLVYMLSVICLFRSSSSRALTVINCFDEDYRYLVYRKVSSDVRLRFYLFAGIGGGHCFIKSAHTEKDISSIMKELRFYQKANNCELLYSTPNLLDYNIGNDSAYIAFEALEGFIVEKANRRSVVPVLEGDIGWREIGDIVREIDEDFIGNNLRNDSFYKILFNNLSSRIKCGPIHGDLGSNNILISEITNEIVVIDWENYNEMFPLYIDELGALLGDMYEEIVEGNTTILQSLKLSNMESKLELLCSIYYFEKVNFRAVLNLKRILRNEHIF